MSEITIEFPLGHIIIVECANCHQEIEVPAELIGDNLEPDQILPYICDECEAVFDEAADDRDHECPCGCEGDDSRCVYALSFNAKAKEKIAHFVSLQDHFFVNSRGYWECVHCGTSALMFESVRHNAKCPALIQQLSESIAAVEQAGVADVARPQTIEANSD